MLINKNPSENKSFRGIVPRTGLEPVQHYCHRILSPACLPFHHLGNISIFLAPRLERAKDETRTRDPDLGKVVLYQLSYFRIMFTQRQKLGLRKYAFF